MLQFAVVCLASAPYTEPLNGGAYAAIVEHEMSDACQNESTTQPWLLATNFVRVNVLHEPVCALNSEVLDREWGSPQFCEQKSPKQIAHTGKTSVFEPLCGCCVGVVWCCVVLWWCGVVVIVCVLWLLWLLWLVVVIVFLLLVVGCADVLLCCDADALRRGAGCS